MWPGLLVDVRSQQRYSMSRYSKYYSGSCMSPPSGCHRSIVKSCFDIRWSIDMLDDENTRNSDGGEVTSKVSTSL